MPRRRPESPSTAPARATDAAVPARFEPFADAAAVETVGGLSIENGTTRIAIHGSLDLTRDRPGLSQAKALRAAIDRIVRALEEGDLPEAVAEAPDTPPRTVRNPFA